MKLYRIGNVVLFAILCAMAAPGGARADTMRMIIQSDPDAGGKCLNVSNGQLTEGMPVQIADCTATPAQVFVYDEQNQTLTFGGDCVESTGAGNPQDGIGLGSCNGAASQRWSIVQAQDFYKVVGLNGLCLDIGHGAMNNGTPLNIYTCADGDPVQLWALVEAPPANAASMPATGADAASTNASAGTPRFRPNPRARATMARLRLDRAARRPHRLRQRPLLPRPPRQHRRQPHRRRHPTLATP